MDKIFGNKVMGGKSFNEIEEESQMNELHENQQKSIKERLFGNNNIMNNMNGVNFSDKVMGGEKFDNFMSGKMNGLDSPGQYKERVSLLTRQSSNNPFNNMQKVSKNKGEIKMNFNNNMKNGSKKVNEYFGNNKIKNKMFGGSANNKMFGNAKNVASLFQNPFNGGNNVNNGSKKINEYLNSNQVKNKLFSDGVNNKLFGNAKNVTELFQSPFKKDNTNVKKTVSEVLGFGFKGTIPGINNNVSHKLFVPGALNKVFGMGNNKIAKDIKSKNKDLGFEDVDETVDTNKKTDMDYLGLPMLKGTTAADMESIHEFKPVSEVVSVNNIYPTRAKLYEGSNSQTDLNKFINSAATGSMEVPPGITLPDSLGTKIPSFKNPVSSNNGELSRLLMERNKVEQQLDEYKKAFTSQKDAGRREQYRKLMADLNRRLTDLDKSINDVKKFERETSNKGVIEKEKTQREKLKYDFERQKLSQQLGLSQKGFELSQKQAKYGIGRDIDKSILAEEMAKSERELAKQRLGLQTQAQSDKFTLERQRMKDAKQAGDITFMQSKLQAGQQLMGGLLGGKGQTDLSKVLGVSANDNQISRLVATRSPYEPQDSFEQKVFTSVGGTRPEMQQPIQPQVQFQPQDPQYQPQQPLPREQTIQPNIDWDRVTPQQAAQIDPEYAKYMSESGSGYRRGPYKKR